MARASQDRLEQASYTAWRWGWLRPAFRLRIGTRATGLLPLLLSAAVAEVAGSMVYVALLQKAYELGGGAASAGGVLLMQSMLQVLLGVPAGNLADRLGQRKAAMLATFANAVLAVGLAPTHTIVGVYVLAFLIMLARLVLIPARLALASYLSGKTRLVATNTVLTSFTSLGLFLGPGVGAALALRTGSYNVPLVVAGLGLLSSMLPLGLAPAPPPRGTAAERVSMLQEMRKGWQFIRKHSPIWKVLMCLVTVTSIVGVVTPLLTPLARHLGLGTEGTGVLLSAMGLGGLFGPWLTAGALPRSKPFTALLLSGLLAPAGLVWSGISGQPEGVFAAVALTALAGASMNVIVTTILQRLTPSDKRGYVLGTQQAVLGLAWAASLAATTGAAAIWLQPGDPQTLFLFFGGFGLLAFLACLFWDRSPLAFMDQLGAIGSSPLSVVCRASAVAQLPVSSAVCRLLCGSQCQCHNSVEANFQR